MASMERRINTPPEPSRSRPLATSVALHTAALLLVLLSLRTVHPPRVLETKIPGTALGNTILTYYSPGSLNTHQGGELPKPILSSKALTAPAPIVQHPAPKPLPDTATAQGTGDSVQSGLGQGDMRIALPSYHPDPAPNLASMQPGSGGDVVLDAVIDETGHISKLTVLNSLGPTIDQSVIATVQQWLFTPATLDGKPVSSGQELHFHYQRKDTAA